MSGGGGVGSTVSSAASAPINTVAQNTASPPSAQSTPPANNSGGQLGQLQGNFGPMQNPFFYQQPMYGGGFGGGYNQQSMQNPFFYQQPMYGGGYGGSQVGGGFGGGVGGAAPSTMAQKSDMVGDRSAVSYINPNRNMFDVDLSHSSTTAENMGWRNGQPPQPPADAVMPESAPPANWNAAHGALTGNSQAARPTPMGDPYGQQQQWQQPQQWQQQPWQQQQPQQQQWQQPQQQQPQQQQWQQRQQQQNAQARGGPQMGGGYNQQDMMGLDPRAIAADPQGFNQWLQQRQQQQNAQARGGPQMGDPRSYLNPNRSMLLPDYASSDDFSRRGGPRPSLPLGGLQEVLSNFPRNTRAMPMDNPYGQQQQYSQANQNPYGQPMGGMRGGYGGIDSLLGGRGGFGFMYKKGGKV